MAELPEEAVDEAVRLTRLARAAVDRDEAAAYREDRSALLADHGYRARVRDDDGGAVLVCYPGDWATDGVVDPADIEDVDRAVERPLSGAGDPDDWATVESHNRTIAEAVAEAHGPVHGATADAFVDFMGNHYARRVETAGPRECREFLEEYLPRNAWPTEAQLSAARESLRLTFETADADPPPVLDGGRSTT
ncbi:MAG: rnhA operon protein [Halobacteriales archaeon]|nr:rnhA operon protein [Halobacteriales archaeon]